MKTAAGWPVLGWFWWGLSIPPTDDPGTAVADRDPFGWVDGKRDGQAGAWCAGAPRDDEGVRVLVLTGPPAVGKTTIGRLLAGSRPRGVLVDIDDVRHMVVGGHAAPWDGVEGRAQQHLGVINGCGLARTFVQHGYDVVIVDVLTNDTAARYREFLDDPLIVHLTVSYPAALRRARTRPVHLTWDEFRRLHDQQADLTTADRRLDTDHLTADRAAAELSALWPPSGRHPENGSA
jgi:predicted kinase